MNDEVVVSGPAHGVGEVTAGTLMRQAREARGLHIGALAVAMKVPVKKLEALEADRLEDLPDAVFVRALAASVCRTLKLEPGPVLSKLPQSMAPKLEYKEQGIRMPAESAGFSGGHGLVALAGKPSVLLVVLLLAAALAVVVLPETRSVVDLLKPAPAAPAAAPGAAESEAAAAVPVPVPASPMVPPAAAPEALASAPLAVLPQAPVSAPARAASASLAASEPRALPATGLLVFTASGKSWVRVSDSRGVVQFEKTLVPGETAVADGVPPLSVVVGNVAATAVTLRGQPYALDDSNRDNVARFEVK